MEDCIRVRPRFVVWTGSGYEISGYPGVGLCSLNTGRQTRDEDFTLYKEISESVEDLFVNESCTLGELKAMTHQQLGINEHLANPSVTDSIYLSAGNELCRCINEGMTLRGALRWFSDSSEPYALALLSRVAGEVFRDELDGITLSFRSGEQGHNKPHIHVDYHHDAQLVINILDDRILKSDGRMPGKVRRKVCRLIRDRRKELMHYWNARTNGLVFDINTGLRLTEVTDMAPQ